MSPDKRQRLAQIIALVDKEGRHLAGVRQRLLGNNCAVNTGRLNELLADDIVMDRLESSGAKFGRGGRQASYGLEASQCIRRRRDR